MKSLIQRMLVSTAIGLVSLTSAGHAMAASPHHAPVAQARYGYQAPLDVAAIPPYPSYSSPATPSARSGAGYDIAARTPYPQWDGGYPFGPDVAGLLATLVGGGVPLHYSGKVTVSGSGSADLDYTPPDTSAADAAGWAAQQMANDASQAAIQTLNQELSDMNAQNAATEANIAAQQAMDQQTMTNLVNSQ